MAFWVPVVFLVLMVPTLLALQVIIVITPGHSRFD